MVLKNNWYKSICFTDGYPGGFCSISVKCKDDNSVCSSDICQCISGYRNIEAVCREGKGFFLLINTSNDNIQILIAFSDVKRSISLIHICQLYKLNILIIRIYLIMKVNIQSI